MKTYFMILFALILSACITSKEKESENAQGNNVKADSVFIGYGYQQRATVGLYQTFIFHRGPDPLVIGPEGVFTTDTFSVFINLDFISRDLDFSRTLSAIKLGRQKLFDVGNHCLSFTQTGKDTILIDKKTVIVSVPIEPCVPYLTKVQ